MRSSSRFLSLKMIEHNNNNNNMIRVLQKSMKSDSPVAKSQRRISDLLLILEVSISIKNKEGYLYHSSYYLPPEIC